MRTRLLVAVVMALIGLVWIAQGLAIVGGSGFMIGNPFWAVVGVVLIALAAVIVWSANRSRPTV
jgi:glucose dehydrogenase